MLWLVKGTICEPCVLLWNDQATLPLCWNSCRPTNNKSGNTLFRAWVYWVAVVESTLVKLGGSLEKPIGWYPKGACPPMISICTHAPVVYYMPFMLYLLGTRMGLLNHQRLMLLFYFTLVCLCTKIRAYLLCSGLNWLADLACRSR